MLLSADDAWQRIDSVKSVFFPKHIPIEIGKGCN